MSKRRHPPTPSLSMQLDVLFARRLVICAICGEVIERREDCEWDHTHEHADGGGHVVDNLRPVHDRATGGCHARKSAKAVSQRSKIDRLETARAAVAAVTAPAALAQTVDPGERCRRCGEYADTCTCPPPAKSNGFSRRTIQTTERKHP